MFDEKTEEMGLPVWQTPKYKTSRQFAIDLINSKQYDIEESDFWILMNKSKTGKMLYSGLIISHNGCLKINDKLENKFNPHCVTLDKNGYKDSLVYTYIDDDVYEIGEVSAKNCTNSYPYAMAFKRCFDRVVLKKSKLAFQGIYSDSEAEEFREPEQRMEQLKKEAEAKIKAQAQADLPLSKDEEEILIRLIQTAPGKDDYETRVAKICKSYGVTELADLKRSQYVQLVGKFK